LNLGATRFLQKPLDLDKFLATVKDLLDQGMPTLIQPLSDVEFYQEYRKRLQAKREEKIKQIARDEHLLKTVADQEDMALHASLRQAIQERDEIGLLLDQIDRQLEKYAKA
jgi:hypothetical protein